MTNDPARPTEADGAQARRRPRRETTLARRKTRLAGRKGRFGLAMWRYSLSQIAKKAQAGAATVRREINRALAEGQFDAPEGFAQTRVPRLIKKALRLAETAIELGETTAVATYLRLIAALDRYHELAAGSPQRPSGEAPPLAPRAPPKALTDAAHAGDRPPADEARSEADDICGEGGCAPRHWDPLSG